MEGLHRDNGKENLVNGNYYIIMGYIIGVAVGNQGI